MRVNLLVYLIKPSSPPPSLPPTPTAGETKQNSGKEWLPDLCDILVLSELSASPQRPAAHTRASSRQEVLHVVIMSSFQTQQKA